MDTARTLTAAVVKDGEWYVARCLEVEVALRHPDGRVAIVPLHKSVARGTLSSIQRQAGLATAQLIALLG